MRIHVKTFVSLVLTDKHSDLALIASFIFFSLRTESLRGRTNGGKEHENSQGMVHFITDSIEHVASASSSNWDAVAFKGYISSRNFHWCTYCLSSPCCCYLCCPLCTLL